MNIFHCNIYDLTIDVVEIFRYIFYLILYNLPLFPYIADGNSNLRGSVLYAGRCIMQPAHYQHVLQSCFVQSAKHKQFHFTPNFCEVLYLPCYKSAHLALPPTILRKNTLV